MPGTKLVRRALTIVLILSVVLFGANAWMTSFAERQVATAIKRSFELERDPMVELRGFPILLAVLRGRLEGVGVLVEDMKIEDLRVARLSVELDDVELVGGILSGSVTTIRVGEGRVIARVDQKAVNRLLRARGEDAVVRLRPGSVRATSSGTFLGARRTIVASGSMKLQDGVLRFEPESVTVDGEVPPEPLRSEAERQARIAVELPALPGNLTPTRIQVIKGAARLSVALADSELDLSGDA